MATYRLARTANWVKEQRTMWQGFVPDFQLVAKPPATHRLYTSPQPYHVIAVTRDKCGRRQSLLPEVIPGGAVFQAERRISQTAGLSFKFTAKEIPRAVGECAVLRDDPSGRRREAKDA